MNDKIKKTMAWLIETCDLALTEAQGGDTTLLNRLGKNGSFAYYLNNVHTRKVMSPDQFAAQFPHQVKELNEIREQYEALTAVPVQETRLQAVEEGLTELKTMMAQFIESQKPAKKVKGKAEVTESKTDEGEASEEE